MRHVTALSGLVLVGALLGPGTAAASGDHDDDGEHRWIAVEDQFAIVLPNGDTFTDEDPPPGEEEPEPPIGARVFIGEALHATDDGETPGERVGRTTVECTVQAITTTFLCDIVFVVDEAGQLHGTVLVDFGGEDGGEALQFEIAVTGGTGDFSGATGTVLLTDISDPEDPEAPTTTLYETDLDGDDDHDDHDD